MGYRLGMKRIFVLALAALLLAPPAAHAASDYGHFHKASPGPKTRWRTDRLGTSRNYRPERYRTIPGIRHVPAGPSGTRRY